MILALHAVRSPDPSGLLLWCVLGFVAGIGLFVHGFHLLQRRRLILDTPFSKIRSASMGMVEVGGLAVGPYTMIAPITARPCYYYRTLVWEYKQDGRNKKWVKVAGECMHVPFFIDDNTGRLLVNPRGADLDLHRDFKEEFNGSFFSSSDIAPGNINSFLARHGIATSNKIKVEEYCIKPKNSLFILGTLAENPRLEVSPTPIQDHEVIRSSGYISITSSGASVRNTDVGMLARHLGSGSVVVQTQVIRLAPEDRSGQAANSLLRQKIADAFLKAEISKPAQWSAAGVATAGSATPGAQVIPRVHLIEDPSAVAGSAARPGSAANANGFEPHPPVVLTKGENNKTFLISWRSRQEVARSLGWKCTLMIWGGPALALLSLYFFVAIEGLF